MESNKSVAVNCFFEKKQVTRKQQKTFFHAYLGCRKFWAQSFVCLFVCLFAVYIVLRRVSPSVFSSVLFCRLVNLWVVLMCAGNVSTGKTRVSWKITCHPETHFRTKKTRFILPRFWNIGNMVEWIREGQKTSREFYCDLKRHWRPKWSGVIPVIYEISYIWTA